MTDKKTPFEPAAASNIQDMARRVLFLAGAAAIVLTLIWLPLGLAGLAGLVWLAYVTRPPGAVQPVQDDKFIRAPIDGQLTGIRQHEGEIVLRFAQPFMASHIWVMPCGGEIDSNLFVDGVFLANDDPASRALNARREIDILASSGRSVRLIQWGGPLARYLACSLPEGRKMQAGEPAGLTLVQGYMDLVLPAGMRLLAETGQRCLAGETILAE